MAKTDIFLVSLTALLGFRFWMREEMGKVIFTFTFASVVFRSELVVLFLPIALHALWRRNLSFFSLFTAGYTSFLVSLGNLSSCYSSLFIPLTTLPQFSNHSSGGQLLLVALGLAWRGSLLLQHILEYEPQLGSTESHQLMNFTPYSPSPHLPSVFSHAPSHSLSLSLSSFSFLISFSLYRHLPFTGTSHQPCQKRYSGPCCCYLLVWFSIRGLEWLQEWPSPSLPSIHFCLTRSCDSSFMHCPSLTLSQRYP